MAYRVLVQVLVTGSQVFSRAFLAAFKQARSANLATAAETANNAKIGGLSLSEARKILGVEDGPLKMDAAQKKYDYLFDANSKDKTGSFYLQSKVYRAMERIKLELGDKTAPGKSAEAPKSADAKPKE